MAKFWKSEKFKELKIKWYDKLKESGFNDAEKEVNDISALKTHSSCDNKYAGIYRFSPQVMREAKEDYYRILSQQTSQEQNFEDDFDRLILERTSEGKSIKEISIELKGLLSPGMQRGKYNRRTIRYVRRRYENKWGIKKWTLPQMGIKKKPIR